MKQLAETWPLLSSKMSSVWHAIIEDSTFGIFFALEAWMRVAGPYFHVN